MNRTLTSVALALLMTISMVTVPVAAAGGDASIVRYGADGDASFIVEYENGSLDSVETWAEENSRYSILQYENDTNEVLVKGPRFQIESPGFWQDPIAAASAGTIAPTPLEDRGYVTDVSPNYRHSYADPLTSLATESTYETPASNWLVKGRWSTDGIAFNDDANESLLADVRQANGANKVDVTGAGMRGAYIDTGLNARNGSNDPLFQDRIVGARNFVSDQDAYARNDFANVSDGDGHGSWVTGAAAANATNDSYDGMAPDSEILVAKALDDDGSGSTQDIVDAIRWAEANDADVLSMSLGSVQYDEAIAGALRDFLAGNGTVAYVAVGNSRMTRPAQIASPSDVPEEGIIGVAATNTSAPANASPAYFSQTGTDNGYSDGSAGTTRGEGPDLAQPGMEITAPVFTMNGYRDNSTLSGTSMSTPIEAGRGLLGLAANPSLENKTAGFAGWVENTTDPVPNAGTTEVGNGIGNVTKLVNRNASNRTQKEARNDPAKNRDRANQSFGQDFRFQAVRRVFA
jgi:hypothetical protein